MPPQNTSDGFNDDMVALQTVQSNYDCHVVRLSALLKSDSQKIRLHLLFLDPRNLQRWFCPWWTMRSPGARMHRSERKLCNSAPHVQKCTDEKYRFAGKEPLKAHESMKAHWQRNIISNTSVSPTKANFLSELNTYPPFLHLYNRSQYVLRIPDSSRFIEAKKVNSNLWLGIGYHYPHGTNRCDRCDRCASTSTQRRCPPRWSF